jgi:hypothetical protein
MPSNATILYPDQIDPLDPRRNPAEYPLRYLAEGDSWFSFGSWKLHSLLSELKLERPTAVVCLAEPGATVRRIAWLAKNPALKNWLSRSYGAYAWNALLLSGGGNDVIDEAGKIVPPSNTDQPDRPAAEYVDQVKLDALLEEVRVAYRTIVALRDAPDSPCPGVPAVTQAYDFITPRDAPATFGPLRLGPWLYPAMVAARIPVHRWNDISDHVLAALSGCLVGLEGELPNFHVVRSQGTIARAELGTTKTSRDWSNEIHPTRNGYRKLAKLYAQPLEALT